MYSLVFFNTFEELTLPIKGPMEDAGVMKLYGPSLTLCLYVVQSRMPASNEFSIKLYVCLAPAEKMVGRVPPIRFFWLATQLQISPTFLASTKFQASRLDAPIQQLLTEGGATMSMTSPRGCISLGTESPAWEG